LAHFRGDGVRQSLRLAAKWLRAAARLGQPDARSFLERMERGERLD
jgi:TPR repeat protein